MKSIRILAVSNGFAVYDDSDRDIALTGPACPAHVATSLAGLTAIVAEWGADVVRKPASAEVSRDPNDAPMFCPCGGHYLVRRDDVFARCSVCRGKWPHPANPL